MNSCFCPRLLDHAAHHAPRIAFRTITIPSPGAGEALEEGVADLALGYFPDLEKPGFYQQRLFRNSFTCIVRAQHPRIGAQLTREAFLREGHAIVRPAGRTHLFERFMEKRRIVRDVRADLAHFTTLLTVIATSDLIATVPLDIGNVFSRLADIRTLAPPFQTPPFDVKQHWHRRVHADAASIWLRKTVRNLYHD